MASGAGQATSQKALEAPRPSGAPQKKAGLVEQVACASARSCGAFGIWLYTEPAGKWKAATVPGLPHAGGPNLRSIACPAAGRCEVVGMAGVQHLLAVTEHGRQWRSTGFALPGNAAPIKPADGPSPFASGVSCPAAGTCTVVGDSYIIRDGRFVAPLKANTIRINDNITRLLQQIVGITKDVKGTLVWAADEVVYAPEIAVTGVHADAIAGFMEGLD